MEKITVFTPMNMVYAPVKHVHVKKNIKQQKSENHMRKQKMTERWRKKCNKMCHCPNAEGECTNCECGKREEDSTYEGGGVVIDDTGECESCQ